MGFFRRLFGGHATEAIRLEIAMDYSLDTHAGRASLRWITSIAASGDLIFQSRCYLGALLFGRMLYAGDSRHGLLARVSFAAQQALEESGQRPISFEPWELDVDGVAHTLWPWRTGSDRQLIQPSIYVAKLLLPARGDALPSLNLDVPFVAPHRVTNPTSVLLTLSSISSDASAQGRMWLALLLIGMIAAYSSGEAQFSPTGESVALHAGLVAIRKLADGAASQTLGGKGGG